MIKRIATIAAECAELTGLLKLLDRVEPERPDLLRVLTYHRVADPSLPSPLYPGLISATPEGFDSQMAHVSKHYRVLSIGDVLEARRSGSPLPPRALLVTFDDGYRDFAELAWPTLRRHGVPAALFVPTAFPDHPERTFWWERLYHATTGTLRREALDTEVGQLRLATAAERLASFKRLRDQTKSLPHDEAMELVTRVSAELGDFTERQDLLGWDELRALARDGVTLGAHTRTHPLMNRISTQRMRDEAVGSLQDLEREIGSALPVFAYPSGGFDDRAVEVLEAEGFELAFTTCRGVNDLRRDHPLRLRRVNVGLRTTKAILRTQLLSAVGAVQRWWLPTSPRKPAGAQARALDATGAKIVAETCPDGASCAKLAPRTR